MKGSARIIAICGICGAISCVFLLITSLVPYLALICGVIAAVATTVPMLVDGRYLGYSLLVFGVTVTIGAVCGVFVGNVTAVAPVVTFCIPFAITKVRCESVRMTAQLQSEEKLDDPFDGDGEARIMHVEINGKPRVHPVVKWVVYYLLLEAGVALTLLFTWLLTPALLKTLFDTKWLLWLLVGAAQLVPPLYDLLLRGCLIAAVKVVRKIVR